jgi:hypothetical protein
MVSKKGQGLAFISILILVGIIFLVFRYNTETYTFVMQIGSEQEHLMTAYTESAKTKSYIENAARQAALETIWNLSNGSLSAGDAFEKIKCDKVQSFFEPLFNKYILIYSPSAYPLVETIIPEYELKFTCGNKKLQVEGFGYKEACVLKENFPFPELPCEDQLNQTACENIKYVKDSNIKIPSNKPKPCFWNATEEKCKIALPMPGCEVFENEVDCNAKEYCKWEVSHSEKLNIIPAPIINYQFLVETDAHFKIEISDKEYEAFTKWRKKFE